MQILEEKVSNLCIKCKDQEAVVFNVLGDYCLGCWQDVTETSVSVR